MTLLATLAPAATHTPFISSPVAATSTPSAAASAAYRSASDLHVRMIHHAMQRQDDLVLSFTYLDQRGAKTRRIVSPIRFLSPNHFLALCLSRCEPRQFRLDRCHDLQLKFAADVVMPVHMSTVAV